MKSLNLYGAKSRSFIAHPLTWLVVSMLAIGLFRSITMPPDQNYDEFFHFRASDPDSIGITDCLRRQDCRTLGSNLTIKFPNDTRIESYRGLPYYFLQALIQAFVPISLDRMQHLIVARFFTVLLGALFIIIVFSSSQELFPKKPLLALLSGIFAAFIPAFSDILSGINLDAPSALVGVIVVYTAIFLAKYGLTFRLLCAIAAEVVIGYTLKSTIWPLFLLVALGLAIRLPALYRNLFVMSLGVVAVAVFFAILRSAWFGTAKWFYPLPRATPNLLLPNQIKQDSVVGKYVLETTSQQYQIFRDVSFTTSPSEEVSQSEIIIQILPEQIVNRLRSKKATFGVWARAANEAATVLHPYCQIDQVDLLERDIQLDARWRFVSIVYDIPLDISRIYCALGVPSKGGVAWYDGMVLVEGGFENNEPLIYLNPDALLGTWGGKTFVNLLRNPSAEQSWLQIDPFLGYPFPVNQRIVSFLSWELTASSWVNLTRWSFVSFWATFGGEQPGLSSHQMIPFVVLTAIAATGIVWTMIYDVRRHQRGFDQPISRYGFWMLIVAVLAIALLIIYRADIVPFRPVIFDFSSMRHASAGWSATSILLALGLLRVVPKRHHRFFAAAIVVFLFVINIHIQLRVQYPLYNCIYYGSNPGGQGCLWILPLD